MTTRMFMSSASTRATSRSIVVLPTPGAPKTAAQWAAATYLSGFLDAKLLSLDLGRVDVSADKDGLKMSADVPLLAIFPLPPLAGAHVEATVDFHDVNVNDAIEQLSLGTITLPHSSTTVPLPRIHLQASLDDELRAVLCEAYFGRLDRQQLARMNLFALMSDVGWTLWGAIQAKISTLDFDFTDYYTTRWNRALTVMESDRVAGWLREARGADP